MPIREARPDDREDVVAVTEDTWSDRFEGGDYVPDVFPEWAASDDPDELTVVYETADGAEGGSGDETGNALDDGGVVGLCRCNRLSEYEAWTSGMRVAPGHRGEGIARALNDACFEWARDRGATVCRNMVFSWNPQGLGTSRGVGYDPCMEFRTVHPEPDPDATADDRTGVAASAEDLRIDDDPDAGWSYWTGSGARDRFRGLALHPEVAWAVSECTRERFHRAAAESALVAVRGPDGTRGVALRSREFDRESDERTERWVEYGLSAWEDVPAAQALFAAIARDAAAVGADRTRVSIPESPRHVSDAAYVGVEVGDDPHFVTAADLTAE